MTRSSFTAILLGGVLAGACSKPNPLFLDTWDVVTDSGSNAQTTLTASSLEPTTVDPTLTATSDPPTTTTGTATSSSDATTTEPTPGTTTETTGEPFVCDGVGVNMEGCCEVVIDVEADTFFSNAEDGVGVGCPVTDPPPGYPMLACEHISFGRAKAAPVFKDVGNIVAAVKGVNMMVLRFPTKDGQLLSDEGPVPSEQIEAIHLVVTGEVEWDKYSDLKFAVHGLGADLTWEEGDNLEDAAACLDGKASFACRECPSELMAECPGPWDGGPQPIPDNAAPIGTVEASQLEMTTGIQPLDLSGFGDPAGWIPKIVSGLALVPSSSTYVDMDPAELVLFPGAKLYARESNKIPQLKLKVCKQ
ncbi:hypothetical protein [Nannocystis sp. SCPEA4]|uniref:hypothetical protein n=1 Tax=Nannocystis sp. SCPEA4 TaxID=2996787 RepID=UPI00226E2D86|nr:hypothetical protein [Nannocystis sp. SCPEA4]MCY1058019.1 hypothetical protein [Nannocystis sp. SCPEA4]